MPGGHHRSVQHDPELQVTALRWLARELGRGERGLEVAHRIDGGAVDPDLEVEVVAEAVAGAADVADHVALLRPSPEVIAKLDWWA